MQVFISSDARDDCALERIIPGSLRPGSEADVAIPTSSLAWGLDPERDCMSSPCLQMDYRGMKADARAGSQSEFEPGTHRSQWQGKGEDRYFCRLQRPEPFRSFESEQPIAV
ncbi:hypothetical protein BO83DRAFT_186568 [Aspergillus eucalypticola CBS 122712]|uniref:Uncharacterized protein n=1 Tax=Aspergillus eucalypticola (strain CBS 122712 / IBT 29274) TaxID=1448314 RepID=A0A317UNE5_ASPEC|nr:uncharacterized protein BO83DRAFT_186568 [Aspergillus eucalypticola CBS 122712]PWY62658.1 hypothetical protein BO83DRAFT_186568 [Aspergillus eucalypticola CBS 122712]